MAISKMVQSRLNIVHKILASYNTNKTETTKNIAAILQPTIPAGNQFTETELSIFLDAVLGRYQSTAEQLQFADEEHNRELGEDTIARTNFQEATTNAYDAVVQFKDTVKSLYGADILEQLQLQGTTPRDGQSLFQLLEMIRTRLSDKNFTLPQQVNSYLKGIDKAAILTHMNSLYSDLSKARRAYEEDLRETEGTLVEKHSKVAEFDQVEQQTIGTLLSMMKLAGLEEEADRLRPTRRKPRRSEEKTVEPVNETGEEGSNTPSTPTPTGD